MEGAEDSYTTTTRVEQESFFSRIKHSLAAVPLGLLLLGLGITLLIWNEGRAVQTAKSLEEGLDLVVPLSTIDVADAEYNGKFVHLVGPLSTKVRQK